MNNVLVYLPMATLVLGGVGGYYLGRYQDALVRRIRELEDRPPASPPPMVTMGSYQPPREINETDAPVGLIQSKTPQRMDWEEEQRIEREGRGFPKGESG